MPLLLDIICFCDSNLFFLMRVTWVDVTWEREKRSIVGLTHPGAIIKRTIGQNIRKVMVWNQSQTCDLLEMMPLFEPDTMHRFPGHT